MNKSQTLLINDDLVVDIHYNPYLSDRPYQLRVYSYNDYSEHRLNDKDILNLAESLADFVFFPIDQ